MRIAMLNRARCTIMEIKQKIQFAIQKSLEIFSKFLNMFRGSEEREIFKILKEKKLSDN